MESIRKYIAVFQNIDPIQQGEKSGNEGILRDFCEISKKLSYFKIREHGKSQKVLTQDKFIVFLKYSAYFLNYIKLYLLPP